jgi:hypothetical protein
MPISNTFKYIIIAFVIIIIVLIILMIVKPNMFFETSSNNGKITDLKRTSKNGDMTINDRFIHTNEIKEDGSVEEEGEEEEEEVEGIHNEIYRTNYGTIRINRTAIHHPTINTIRVPNNIAQVNINQDNRDNDRDNNRDNNRDNDRDIAQGNIAQGNRAQGNRIPVRVEIMNPNMDNIFDMVFNDIAVTLQTMDNNNEFNILQHMNEHNIYPIVLNNNNLGIMDILDNHILDIIGGHRNNIITTNQTTAQQNANTRGDAIDNYIELATRPTNDSQNVHDHTVLSGFKQILERLIYDRHLNSGNKSIGDNNIDKSIGDKSVQDLLSLDEIKNEIKQKERRYSDNRPQVAMKALEVIDKMKNGEHVTAFEIDGNPTTDGLCLQLVWDRANHPLNSKNKSLIKQSIFDNLVDSWEVELFTNEPKIVCVTGRATRMLSSLTLLDFDEQNWEVKKFEDFKNEIFNRVKQIIMEQAEIASLSSDQNMQNAGLVYLAKTAEEFKSIPTPSYDATIDLNNTIKKEISNMIFSYVQSLESDYNTKIPEYMKNSIEKEAIASIDMF